MTHEEWLAAKLKGISGTDIGVLMGANPYKTEYQLLLDKLGLGKPFIGNAATMAGQRLEPIVANWWAKQNQTILINGVFTRSKEDERFIGTPDFLTHFGGIDTKTGAQHIYNKGCPLYYEYQARWYSYITDTDRWDIVATIVPKDRSEIPLNKSDEYLYEWVKLRPMRCFRFRRDRQIEAKMKESALRFLERLERFQRERASKTDQPPASV